MLYFSKLILQDSLKIRPQLLVRFSSLTSKRKHIRTKMDENLKCRENPVVLKLDTPEFRQMFTFEVMTLKALFDKYNYEIRIAGGAVRDLLLGKQPKDVDFATTATPDEMKVMFVAENVRMVNMNGEKHGTITPRINDSENFEVTTLRVDLVTDGRHAEVQFTTDWKLDANRRDLTFNSMFLGFDGSVYDYFFGYDDLLKRRVAFVGDPDVRIKEDYLRIMRYFRFYGRIADKPDNHESATLQVIRQNVAGLENISGERLWIELKSILQGNYAGELMKTMLNVGVGKYIGLPSEPNVEEFGRVWSRARELRPCAASLLAALLSGADEVAALHARLKMSAYDRDLVYFVVEHRGGKPSEKPLLPYQKIVLTTKKKQSDIVDSVREVLKYNGQTELLREFNEWEIPRFPINGSVLMKNGVPQGKMFGPVINKLRDVWAENEFKHTVDDLVKLIPDILSDLEEHKNNKKTSKN